MRALTMHDRRLRAVRRRHRFGQAPIRRRRRDPASSGRESARRTRRVERRILVEGAGGQARGDDSGRTFRAGRHQRMHAARDEAVDQRQQHQAFADAGAVQPDEPAVRARQARRAHPFADARPVFLAPCAARGEEPSREWREQPRGGAVEGERGRFHRKFRWRRRLRGPLPRAAARRSVVRGIEQAVQVDDEIAHVRVVDRRLRLGFPGGIGCRVVREHADDVDLVEVLELVRSRLTSSPPNTRCGNCCPELFFGHVCALSSERLSGVSAQCPRATAARSSACLAADAAASGPCFRSRRL